MSMRDIEKLRPSGIDIKYKTKEETISYLLLNEVTIEKNPLIACNFSGLILRCEDLDHADFRDCDFSRSVFINCSFVKALFENCYLEDVVFIECNLEGVEFKMDKEFFTKDGELKVLLEKFDTVRYINCLGRHKVGK